MNRRDFISLVGGAAAWPLAARAQQHEPKRRVAVLMGGMFSGDPGGQAEAAALEDGLTELGWKPGHNIELGYRWPGAEVDAMRAAAGEITATGFSVFEASIGGKWLALLKEAAPAVSRISLLFNPQTAPFAENYLRSAQAAAQTMGASVIAAPCGTDADIVAAIEARSREGGGGIIGIAETFVTEHRNLIIELAARHRLPAIYGSRIFVPSGGLLAYSADYPDIFRHAAGYADRILKGTHPGDLPVQEPDKFTLSVNLRAAAAIGLTLPPSLIARADEVIE